MGIIITFNFSKIRTFLWGNRLLYLVYLCMLVNESGYAQELNIDYLSGQSSIRFTAIEKGLAGQYVSTVIQDDLGFLWVGTQDGLYRFDGSETKAYRYNPIKESLPGTWARVICQDDRGIFWLGVNGHGLSRFESQNNSFKNYSEEVGNALSSQGLVVSQILCSKAGDVWIRTELGLFKKDKLDDGFTRMMNNSPSIFINETTDGTLLVAKERQLFVYHDQTDAFEPQLENVFIEQLEPTNDEQVILRSSGKVFSFNLKSKEFNEIIFPEKISLLSNYQNNIIYFLGESKLFKYNNLSGTVEALQMQNTRLDLKDVKDLFVDNESVLWVSSRKGLYKENTRGDVFKETIPLHARGIYVDSTHVYVGGRKGFYKYHKENKSITPILENVYVLSLYKTAEGFWLGDLYGNLYFVDHNGDFRKFESIIEKEDSPIREIYGITEDRNGFMWIGSWVGLHLVNKNGDLIRTFDLQKEDTNKAINIAKLHIDRNDNLWITTVGNGVYKAPFISMVSSKTKEFTYDHYVHVKGDETTLNSNVLYEILEEDDGTLLFGSNFGVNIYDQNADAFTALKKEAKLFDLNVMSLKKDKNDLLWISTINDGIFVYDKVKNKYFSLNQNDGLISNACLFNSSFLFQNELFFGTEDHVQIIDPHKLIYPTNDKEPLILNLNVYGEEETPSASILNDRQVNLDYDQSNFTIRFQLLDFRFSDKVNYFYKINEIQEEWRQTSVNTANYTNLQPGAYNFLLKATYDSQVSDAMPVSTLSIVITPPWWKTWWAYLIYFILIATLAYLFYRFKVSRKLAFEESKRLKEINKLKNSLYTNITHEFRTPLTVILGMAGSIKDKLGQRNMNEVDKPLEMIERNGENLLHLVNEMLDLAKLESGNMELNLVHADVVSFIKYICESLQSYATESKINVVVYAEVDHLLMDFDEQKLQAIVCNLLSNAIKFSAEGDEIIVHLNKLSQDSSDFLYIKVKDNGVGIAEEALPHIFNRFYQEDAPMTRKGEGTGVGLSLTKSFVELMNGSITVKSQVNKGSEFEIQLPVSSTASISSLDYRETESPQVNFKKTKVVLENTVSKASNLPLALIIEDNTDVAFVLKSTLSNKYQTLHAENGQVGLEMAFDVIPDVVICDVMMPVLDGYEVCETLKTDHRTNHIPIIMLTAKVTQKDRLSGLSHGADSYLVKPFETAELLTRMNQLILLRKKLVEKFENDGLSSFLKSRTENPADQFLKNAIRSIHDEIGNANFGAKQLAFQLHLSESQTYRKIKSITNVSTAVFIRSVRLKKAKELVLETNDTISEIAYAVGFNDPSWFSRAFKDEFGCSPSAMRN